MTKAEVREALASNNLQAVEKAAKRDYVKRKVEKGKDQDEAEDSYDKKKDTRNHWVHTSRK
jgi:hypothetical protein